MIEKIVISISSILFLILTTKSEHLHRDCSRLPLITIDGFNATNEIKHFHQLNPERAESLSFHMTAKHDCTKPLVCKEEIKQMEKYITQNWTGTWLQFYIDKNGNIHKGFLRSNSLVNYRSSYNVSITLLGNYANRTIPEKMMHILNELQKCFTVPRSLNGMRHMANYLKLMKKGMPLGTKGSGHGGPEHDKPHLRRLDHPTVKPNNGKVIVNAEEDVNKCVCVAADDKIKDLPLPEVIKELEKRANVKYVETTYKRIDGHLEIVPVEPCQHLICIPVDNNV
uniref:Peptidoglycan recognition protein family domain-containing protein n=1 Tax=Strigamia maritima TaxID=126957 RepID=T1JMS0_STRMM